jgi:hypothetical protein
MIAGEIFPQLPAQGLLDILTEVQRILNAILVKKF